MSRRVDFDAFRASQKKEPVVLVIGGEEVSLAADIPANIILDIMAQGADADVEDASILALLDAAFGGEEKRSEIVSRFEIGLTELGDLARMVMSAYSGEPPEGNRAARRKGRASK